MTVSVQRLDSGLPGGDQAARLPVARALEAVRRRQRTALACTIESHVVPRLLVARAPAAGLAHATADISDSAVSQEVLDLIALALGRDDGAVKRQIEARLRLHTLEQVCADVLAPAARHLGHLWDEDLCSMADVTLGVLRLQSALHEVATAARSCVADGFRRHRILLAPVQGEQHTFGLTAIAMFFERAGWAVTRSQRGLMPEMTTLLRREWFGVLGLSVGSEAQLALLHAEIPRLREASRNAGLVIIVGGPVLSARPDLAAQIGADATAADGIQATWLAENLLAAGPVHS
jgi:methanogenic corrinoid protein MtbC1